MSENRKTDGFNLAFLDVMACGLGAVLMILILVKFNAFTSIPTNEVERLQEELAALKNQRERTEKSIDEVNDKVLMETATLEELKKRIEQLKVQQDDNKKALRDKIAVVANLEKSVAAAAPKQSDDLLKLKGGGEENYIVGLKVEGKHIGILIDKSASMMEEALIDVIKGKISSAAVRKSSAKWHRTVRVSKWLLARLPKESKVSVVAFSDTANYLGTRPVYTSKFSQSVSTLANEIDKLVPENGTNLQTALNTIKKAMPNMTDLYVITDGLPTLGERSPGLESFTKCGSFFGNSKTITGECRLRLFEHTIKTSAPKGVTTNIVLLPLEGDPAAYQSYWAWAASTGGMVISPAGSWP